MLFLPDQETGLSKPQAQTKGADVAGPHEAASRAASIAVL
jgi:hypothetical protein